MDPHGGGEMSVADTFEFDVERVRPQGAADTRPAPGIFTFDWDATKASAEQAYWDSAGRARATRDAEISRAANELARATGKDMNHYNGVAFENPTGGFARVSEDVFWRDLARARRTRPDLLDDFAKDRADFDRRLAERFRQGTASRAQRMGRGGLLGNLAGGVAGSFTDPVNVYTLPVGGWGRSAATRILTEGAAQAGIQIAQTPLLMMERNAQGGELGGDEVAWNVALAALGGAAFKGAEIGAGAGARKIAGAIPEDLKAAIALRRAKPDFAMTPDEAAAMNVIARGTEIDAENPFSRTYEGMEVHAARVDEMIARMEQWPAPASVPALAPARRQPSAPPRIAADFATAWRAIIGIEGGTNRDGSFRTSPAGAIGPAQVMPGTAPEAARLAGLAFDERRYRTDAAYNEALGQAYYREMLRQFDGDPAKAAAAYNAGPGSARRGTGVRGAMARAQRAGVPDEWVSFLPAETRAYVANFRRRTGAEAGTSIDAGDLVGLGEFEGAPARAPELDAERPLVDMPDGESFEIAQVRNSPDVDMPELRRDLFGSEEAWRVAQAAVDAEAFGTMPVPARAAFEVPEPIARSPLRDNHLTDLADYTPQIWREMDGRKAEQFLPNSRASYDGYTNNELFFSDNPDLALGQGNNRGVLMQFDAAGLRGTVSTAKPAWEVGFERGTGSEYLVKSNSGDPYRQNLQAVRIANDAKLDKVARSRLTRALDELESQGWRKTQTADFVQYERPVAHPFEEAPAGLDDAGPAGPAARDEIEAAGGTGPAVADVEAGRVFDDPGGDPVARAAELAWHDAQMAAAARQAPEQLTFDLGDGRGERTMADIEAELRADEDAIGTIESCLAPRPAGGEA